MKKKLILVGIALTAVLTIAISMPEKSEATLKINGTSMTNFYWQKMPCPVGFAGYICSYTDSSYPTCNDHSHWNCVER